ncbi:uncharacterized protein LOC131158613 [Malania oleifera]|uniref:uncharacterized protein LOC131158613 n=1 Tax=Malania oleifera TaxID=397392 RepID=UPI0025AE211C|nr:uncharacterized protein LOC131158613 [Malania oleifera]
MKATWDDTSSSKMEDETSGQEIANMCFMAHNEEKLDLVEISEVYSFEGSIAFDTAVEELQLSDIVAAEVVHKIEEIAETEDVSSLHTTCSSLDQRLTRIEKYHDSSSRCVDTMDTSSTPSSDNEESEEGSEEGDEEEGDEEEAKEEDDDDADN